MAVDALSRSRPPREQNQQPKPSMSHVENAVEEDSLQAQDQDQSFFSLIQASTISLCKMQVQQFFKAQLIDPDIAQILAQSEKELKW